MPVTPAATTTAPMNAITAAAITVPVRLSELISIPFMGVVPSVVRNAPAGHGGTRCREVRVAPVGTLGRMRWAISGGAGFLGLHLARRLLADGHEVRTLDLAPLDDAGLEASVEELRGDIRSVADCRRLVEGADVLVHAAAALPIQ